VGTGRFEEGVKNLLMGEEMNPVDLRPKVLSAWTLYQTRDYHGTISKGRELVSMNPEYMQSHLQLANALTEIGKMEEAVERATRAAQLEPDSPLPLYVLCFCLARAGALNEAVNVIEKWESVSNSIYVPPYFLGMAHLAVGNVDLCFEYLDKARVERSPWAIWIGTEPKLDAVRDDPRYLRLLQATNNPIIERFGPDNKVAITR
jgi:tetratricopeptide (TPR) repeat protein